MINSSINANRISCNVLVQSCQNVIESLVKPRFVLGKNTKLSDRD